MTPFKISNKQARGLWLWSQGLGAAPTGKLDLAALIHRLGFVQLDTIQVVARAHHHIIWSRNHNYRAPMLNKLMLDRGIFEHFTHDASVLPMEFYTVWQRQMERKKNKIDTSGWYKSMLDATGREAIKARIEAEGPLSTHAFDTKIEGKKEMWARPPHKLALDYMWYAGELSTSHREGFTKFYDLTERVVPHALRSERMEPRAEADWLCDAAMDRMGFGTLPEVRKFWDATDVAEVRDWSTRSDLVPVEIEGADGSWTSGFAPADIEVRLSELRSPTSRLRILNPFDPVIRDRDRLERLFGFEYRVEMFVPAAKRKWGYYVFPLLEGDRMVGRIEAKADRKSGVLGVSNLWVEPGVNWTPKRAGQLDHELKRLEKLSDCENTEWSCARLL